ncbi:MAG: hypothetical protein GXC73_01695, partial [Chitinophagaceae bacterium]|nr:hypothetical protein [Chitinophagaceae bacterium]
RTITFIRKEFKPTEYFDTIYISLLQKSILLKRGKELLEIDSIVKLKEVLFGFGVGSISENGTIKGLAFSIEDKVVKAEISTFHDRWAWDIRIEEKTKTILIEYNEFKDNRLSHIYVRDENLRSGFVVSTSLRTLKKIETVESLYSDTIKINNTTVRTNVIAPNQRFYFSYKKSGSLKSIQGKGEMKLCDCTTQF